MQCRNMCKHIIGEKNSSMINKNIIGTGSSMHVLLVRGIQKQKSEIYRVYVQAGMPMSC